MKRSSPMRDSAVMTAQAIVGRAVGVASNVILVRLLDVASFGTVTVITTASANVYGLARLGIDAAIHVETASTVGDDNRVRGEVLGTGLTAMSVTGLLASGATFLAAPWLAKKQYGMPELSNWLRVAAFIVLAQCLAQFAYAAIVGLHRFTAYAKAMTIGAVVGAVLMITGAYVAGLKGAAIAAVLAAYASLACVGYVLFGALRQSGTLTEIRVSSYRLRAMLRLGMPLYLSGLITIPVTAILQGLLTKSQGTDGLAYLRIATVFSSLVGFIPHSIAAVTVSNLSSIRSTSGGTTAFADAAVQRIKLVWAFALLAALAIELTLPVAIPILFGKEYSPAVAPAMVAIGSAVLLAVSSVSGQVSYAGRYPKIVLAQAVVSVTAMAIVGFVLIPGKGLLGYMAADLAANAAATVFLLWRAKATWLEHAQRVPLDRLTLMSCVALALSWLYSRQPIAAGLQTALGAVLFASAGFLIFHHILDANERTTLISRVRRLRRQ